jgi:hypothetical protein
MTILEQLTPTATGGATPVDPGNDPTFTAIFYLIFMVILIGSGVVGFRIRQWLMKREKTNK